MLLHWQELLPLLQQDYGGNAPPSAALGMQSSFLAGDKDGEASAWAEVTGLRDDALEFTLMARGPSNDNSQGAQFPFPTLSTGATITVFIFPPVQTALSSGAVWYVCQQISTSHIM